MSRNFLIFVFFILMGVAGLLIDVFHLYVTGATMLLIGFFGALLCYLAP